MNNKVWLAVNTGYDYDHPEVLAVCSSEQEVKNILAELAQTDPHVFPWNDRGYVEVEINKLLRDQADNQ